jgi:hypothetical protein
VEPASEAPFSRKRPAEPAQSLTRPPALSVQSPLVWLRASLRVREGSLPPSLAVLEASLVLELAVREVLSALELAVLEVLLVRVPAVLEASLVPVPRLLRVLPLCEFDGVPPRGTLQSGLSLIYPRLFF